MNLISDNRIDKILDAAWRAYRNAKAGIDVLESIGLSVEGSVSMDKSNVPSACDMSVLFAAQTAAEDVIFEVLGIPRATDCADRASEILAKTATQPDVSIASLRAFLAGLASPCHQDESTTNPNAKPFEITLAITGGMTVYGESIPDAMQKASQLPTDELLCRACWDDPNVTDGYEG